MRIEKNLWGKSVLNSNKKIVNFLIALWIIKKFNGGLVVEGGMWSAKPLKSYFRRSKRLGGKCRKLGKRG